MNFSKSYEFGAVQMCANIVDFENAAKPVFHCKLGFDTAENGLPKFL